MFNNILIVCVCLYATIINAQTTNISKIDSLLSSIASNNEIMGSISIYSNGEEIYKKSMGFADVAKQLPADEFTKYRIGSITKTYTATIIMQLIEEGKLSLNTPLETYFPLIPNSDRIDIESLLRHRSGLFNVTEEKDFSSWVMEYQTKSQMLARFVKNGTVFEPNTKTEYSNTNFILLSYVAEEIENKPFSTIVNSRIVKPLKLRKTEYGKVINTKNNEALSYAKKDENWSVLPETHMSAPMGAGAIVASPTEINIFYQNLFSGKLTSTTSLMEMKKEIDGIGMGMSNFHIIGKESYGHAGRIDGFESLAIYFPNDNLSVAFTTNALNVSIQSILLPVFELYFENDSNNQSKKTSFNYESKDLDVYLGTYNSSETPIEVVFSKNENILIAKTQRQPPFNLIALKKNFFEYPLLGLTFKFDIEKNSVTIEQGGKNGFELKKK